MAQEKTLTRRSLMEAAIAAGAAGSLSAFSSAGEAIAEARAFRPQVVAIYCPLWHPYDHMDSWHGYGWCEWELLKTAPARFPGHYQPLRPSWGYFNESDPKWAAREIDLAADSHIDVFLFDWYWYSGVRLMEETLEKGFLQAPNRKRLKFALMWANHTWSDYFPAPYDKPWTVWLPIRHSPGDLARVIEYGIERYFRQDNYWTVDGRLFFSIFAPKDFIDQLGGPVRTKSVLSGIDAQLARAKLPPMHWNAMTWEAKLVDLCQEAGFHSTSTYNITSTGKTSPNLTQEYEDLIASHTSHWKAMAETSLPHCPVVTMGWDVTPRCEHRAPWPFAKPNYPYGPVIVGNTPERFGDLCKMSAEAVRAAVKRPFAVFVNAWNEWTEGSYLLPEARHGTAYLKALAGAFPVRG